VGIPAVCGVDANSAVIFVIFIEVDVNVAAPVMLQFLLSAF
jgi:hypothetical protein